MNEDSWPEDGEGDQPGFDADDEPALDDDTLDLGESDDTFAADDDEDIELDDESDQPADGDAGDEDIRLDDDAAQPDTDFTVDTFDDEIVGSDPDAVDIADTDAFEPQFPPELALEPMPEPVDGQPWSDPDLLGNATDTADWNNLDYAPAGDDLLAMDASDGGWDSLLGSSDPAVAGLARWWQV